MTELTQLTGLLAQASVVLTRIRERAQENREDDTLSHVHDIDIHLSRAIAAVTAAYEAANA